MRNTILTIFVLLFLSTNLYADNGLVSVPSDHDVRTTADRLENALKAKGMKIFMRVNHSQGAKDVGKALRPTELIVFGNPKVGTPLMQCNQTAGIDLPQKALIWQDAVGKVWFTYNDPNYLADRHALDKCSPVIQKVGKALAAFARSATQP